LNEIVTTIVGNLGDAPELRFTPSGVAVAKLRVASTPRTRDGEKWIDGEPTWVTVTLWRTMAENATESLSKGDRVVVYGTLANRAWQDKENETRYSLELNAWGIGPDLTWVVAKPTDGVHEGAKKRAKGTPKADPFEGAQTTRPAANGTANADTQRAQQGAAPDFAQPAPAAGGAFADL
jgi:single-strand DNA-binding protein